MFLIHLIKSPNKNQSAENDVEEIEIGDVGDQTPKTPQH